MGIGALVGAHSAALRSAHAQHGGCTLVGEVMTHLVRHAYDIQTACSCDDLRMERLEYTIKDGMEAPIMHAIACCRTRIPSNTRQWRQCALRLSRRTNSCASGTGTRLIARCVHHHRRAAIRPLRLPLNTGYVCCSCQIAGAKGTAMSTPLVTHATQTYLGHPHRLRLQRACTRMRQQLGTAPLLPVHPCILENM